ncbi:MAG: peptidase S41 [Muribaculaceae bacterium]|nr:peptidase S41 [Muribaculaceae bacterium]
MMKKILKVLLALVGLVLLSFVGLIIYFKFFYSSEPSAESYYVENLPLKNDKFSDDFHEITEIVRDNYSLYEAKHLNIDSLCDSFSARVGHISTSKEYGELLQEFFASLKVGHSFVYLKEYSAGTFPVYINDSVFINSPNEIMTEAGLKNKDRVIAVNGEPITRWMDRNEKYVSASTPLNRRLYTAANIFRSLSDTVRDYTVCRGNDTILVKLPLLTKDKFPSAEIVKTSGKVLNDSIGYIVINTMMDGVLESFSADFNKVRNLPYLIVDIRNNEGGNSGNGRELCKYFIHSEQPHCIDNKVMTPSDNAYHGKVLLLISPITFSAAESFAIDMKESGNVILIGEPTAGDTGNHPKTFKTSNGICFRIPTAGPSVSPKGFPLEGVGVIPDYYVTQTVYDYFNDKDTQLDFAIDFFKNK